MLRFAVDIGWIEHRHGERAVAIVGVGEFDLLNADLIGLISVCGKHSEGHAEQCQTKAT